MYNDLLEPLSTVVLEPLRQILERVKFLPDKIDHFDWWGMD
jgi:hypothetical protein